MGNIFGHRIDFNRVGVLRGLRHIPSKNFNPSNSSWTNYICSFVKRQLPKTFMIQPCLSLGLFPWKISNWENLALWMRLHMFETRIQHIALLIMCLLTQSGKDCHLAYSQISFTNHTNRHVTSSDWRFTFLCPDLTSSKLSDSVTAHWVLFVVCQDTDANFKIRQRTRLRTCE